MSVKVRLLVTTGAKKGEEYEFGERVMVTVGRSADCHLRFPNDDEYRSISRRHCLLYIDPPHISVRDLGSRNGTFVDCHNIGHPCNGNNVGPSQKLQSSEETALTELSEWKLNDGSEIQVGNVVLRVHIADADIGAESTVARCSGAEEVVPTAAADRKCMVRC